MSGGVFYYFAYASNLLRQRMMVTGFKSMKFECIARIDNYRLTFGYKSNKWAGAVATIESSQGDHVWGAVWSIDESELTLLDDQEGVNKGIYERLEVAAVDCSNKVIKCKSYRLLKTGPSDNKPSCHYLDVILRGAISCGLPNDYIENLKQIEHNGYNKSLPIIDKINAFDNQA